MRRIFRVLVTGSRDWPDPEDVAAALDEAFAAFMKSGGGLFLVVHGHCPTGADRFADLWVTHMKLAGFPVDVKRHPADWKQFKKAAGFRRNAEMVKLGADLCLAFILDESNGSSHTEKLARKAGIETHTFRRSTMAIRPYKRVEREIKLEGVRLIWRNFAGEERPFNAKGKRNFAIPLDEELALELLEIGWNVKEKEKDGEMLYHLPVTVKMDGRVPPSLWLITKTKNRRTQLDEETVVLLDYAEFDLVDVILRPFNWDVQGKQGVAAYLKTGFFVLHEDDLEKKYAHIPIEGATPELENIIDVEGEWVDDEELVAGDHMEPLVRGRERKALTQ